MASPDSEGEIPGNPLKTSSRSVVTTMGGPPFQPRGATTVTRPRGLKGTLRPAKAVVWGVRYNRVLENDVTYLSASNKATSKPDMSG